MSVCWGDSCYVMKMKSTHLSFEHLGAEYNKGQPVLKNIHFSIPKGSYCAIIGSNGSGKSTLLKIIAGLLKPTSGSISQPFKTVAYLPQNATFNRIFPISIGDVLKMSRYLNPENNNDIEELKNALAIVKISNPLECPIQNLSGGQFQRLLFARLLLQNPDLLLLDEPFNGIDEETISDLANVLSDLHKKGRTILIAIHDWNFVNKHIPTIIEGGNGHFKIYDNSNLTDQGNINS